jgi:hypothetical protein
MATIITTTRQIIVEESMSKIEKLINGFEWIALKEKVYSEEADPFTHQVKSYDRNIILNRKYIVEFRH